MQLPSFIQWSHRDKPGSNYLLSSTYPYPIYQVWKFRDEDAAAAFISRCDTAYFRIPDTMVYVVFSGTWSGKHMRDEDMQGQAEDAAQFYWDSMSAFHQRKHLSKFSRE